MTSFKQTLFDSHPSYKWELCQTVPNRASVTEVFDLTQHVFLYKQPLPFLGNAVFRHLKTNTDANSFADTWFNSINGTDENKQCIQIPYPNEFGMRSLILMVVDREAYDALSEPQKEYYIAINAYINLVLRKCIHRSWKEIDASPPLPQKTLYWVWFRKPGYKLTRLIWERAQTWIAMNPEMRFVLWTDIEDATELKEFLSDIQNPEPFWNGRITIKYFEDTINFVHYYLQKYRIHRLDAENYIQLLKSRNHGYTLIAKTDYLRAMILHDQGGFYADFNDCICMVPMRYWFHEMYHQQSFVLPCDTFNPTQISNYFIFVPPNSKEFELLHRKTFASFSSLLKFVRDYAPVKKVIGTIFPTYAKQFLKKLKANVSDPIKQLAEMMIPAFQDPSVINALSAAIEFDVRKGLSLCDQRAKVFFPIYVYKYISEKFKRPHLKHIYDYFSNEFAKIARFNEHKTSSGSITITYFNNMYKEDKNALEDFIEKEYDAFFELLDQCSGDEAFLEFLHYQFLRNFTFIAMDMTNFMLHVNNPSIENLVPFSYVLLNTTCMTLVGHYGDGTSMQRS